MIEQLFAEQVNILSASPIQNSLSQFKEDHISFALGMPDKDLLPIEAIRDASSNLQSTQDLQYNLPPLNLKLHIKEIMLKKNIVCNYDEILITSGAQQAMMLISRLLVNKGDYVIVDEVSYPGFLQIAASYGANLRCVNWINNHGMDLENLEQLLSNINCKFLYTMSDGQNPLGQNIPNIQRKEYANLSQKFDLPIIEDDAYGFLNYTEYLTNPIKNYSPKTVLYIGSFSKIIAPSLRVGWIVAPVNVIKKLEILKETSDINTATFSQHILSAMLEKISVEKHLEHITKIYKKKRDIMVDSLKKYIPQANFIVPSNGFFIWCNIPGINTTQLFKVVKDFKVSFIPGNACSISNKHANDLRLSFSYCNINLIEQGIQRLSKAILSCT
jgi:2-aminoadipate transaminase